MTLLPNHEWGTMIFAEFPNSFAIAVISDTCRVERVFITALPSTQFSLYIRIIIVSKYFPAPRTSQIVHNDDGN